jgi:cyclophilin family peptidyl-prolyl cis-trans isomerase
MFIQGGRIKAIGSGSVFEAEFEDESFHRKHTERGMLGMCKRSGLKHTNETQFYITTGAPLTFLDNDCVAFGRVIRGMDFIEKIEKLETVNEKSANMPVTVCSAGIHRQD